ncbi:hypothetical protein AMTRI_Chr09g38050 [Amborella trichopoda]
MGLGPLPPLFIYLHLRYIQTLYNHCYFFCTSACSCILDLCVLLSHNGIDFCTKSVSLCHSFTNIRITHLCPSFLMHYGEIFLL